jgi:retron-type reverse transcriptase
VTFAAIEANGLAVLLEPIRHELATRTYRPMRLRHQTIPKEGGKGVRVLSIPTIRDRVVQGAFKRILGLQALSLSCGARHERGHAESQIMPSYSLVPLC